MKLRATAQPRKAVKIIQQKKIKPSYLSGMKGINADKVKNKGRMLLGLIRFYHVDQRPKILKIKGFFWTQIKTEKA